MRTWVWTEAGFRDTRNWVIPRRFCLSKSSDLFRMTLSAKLLRSILSTDWVLQLSVSWWRRVRANFKSDYHQHDIHLKLLFKQAAVIFLEMSVSESVARSLCSPIFLSRPRRPLQAWSDHSMLSSKCLHASKCWSFSWEPRNAMVSECWPESDCNRRLSV